MSIMITKSAWLDFHNSNLRSKAAELFTTSRLIKASSLAVCLVLSGASFAADQPAKKAPEPAAPASIPFDFVFGARGLTDYNWRGISQSDGNPAVQAYGELQIMDNFFYAGVAASSVDLATKPTAEIDLMFGIRPKFGDFSFDFGGIGYIYTNEQQLIYDGVIWTPKNTDMFELAGKGAYTWQDLTVGANVFYTWNWLGTGAYGTYTSLTAKYNTPFLKGGYISGELGRYFLGTTNASLGSIRLPDYTYGNIGVGYTYQIATLDLRYHDTNLSKSQCFTLTSDPSGIYSGSGRSNWCGATFIATVSVDITASQTGIFAPK
jgi:uncharacterized protein (TIGR02001 family)